jgi:hypothetical protein
MFGILKDHSLYINEKKTFLCQEVVEYLGHLISTEGVRMDPSKVSVILSWPAPKNVSELRSFLGLSGFYHKFIANTTTECTNTSAYTSKN